MTDLLTIGFVFVFLVLLLRRKVQVGYALLAGAGVLSLLYMLPPAKDFIALKNTFTAPITYELLIALTCIRAFEMILRQQKTLERMMNSMKLLLKNKRAVIISMPLLIGMLPSVGGAYFSAPMVDEVTRDLRMSPEEKAFANYWYRHPWEYILPLYPGIVLASALTEVPLRTYILLNLPYALSMFITGFVFLTRAGGAFSASGADRVSFRSFTPIVALLVLVAGIGLPLHWGLLGIVVVMLFYWRYPYQEVSKVVRHALSVNVIFLTIGVILFKEVLEVSGAVGNLSKFFKDSGIPLLSILFALPFITGILTGVTIGFVGAAFPLLVSLVGHSQVSLSFAFASGFVGVLLSPVHVCLILTKEYFKADMAGIYKRTIPLTGVIMLVALVEYLLLTGTLVPQ